MCQPLPESTELHDSRTRSTMFVRPPAAFLCREIVQGPDNSSFQTKLSTKYT